MAKFKKGDKVRIVSMQMKTYLKQVLSLTSSEVTGEVLQVDNDFVYVTITTGNHPVGVWESMLELVIEHDFNTQAEVWEYLLTGGMVIDNSINIIYKLADGNLQLLTSDGNWIDKAESNFRDAKNIKKYTEPKWYDNIGNGILCWVSDKPQGIRFLEVISSYKADSEFPFTTAYNTNWRCAEPVRQEEIQQYIPQNTNYKVGDYFTVVEKKK